VEEHVFAGPGVDKPETLVRLSLDRTLRLSRKSLKKNAAAMSENTDSLTAVGGLYHKSA
jgi:hypothetical protein